MALIDCPECSTTVSDKAISCPKCGCPIAKPVVAPSPASTHQSTQTIVTVAKSRGTFIILGLLFGLIGLHNFYAGYNGRGATKIVLATITFLMDASTRFETGFFFVAAVPIAIWVLIELFTNTEDARGHALA